MEVPFKMQEIPDLAAFLNELEANGVQPKILKDKFNFNNKKVLKKSCATLSERVAEPELIIFLCLAPFGVKCNTQVMQARKNIYVSDLLKWQYDGMKVQWSNCL